MTILTSEGLIKFESFVKAIKRRQEGIEDVI